MLRTAIAFSGLDQDRKKKDAPTVLTNRSGEDSEGDREGGEAHAV